MLEKRIKVTSREITRTQVPIVPQIDDVLLTVIARSSSSATATTGLRGQSQISSFLYLDDHAYPVGDSSYARVTIGLSVVLTGEHPLCALPLCKSQEPSLPTRD